MQIFARIFLIAIFATMLLPLGAGAQPDLGVDIPRQAGIGLGDTDIRITIARVIRVAMGVLGIVTVVIILYAGFLWMTAGGNDEQVTAAKNWISRGIIGLAIILMAFGISTFVLRQLIIATSSGNVGPGFVAP